MELKNKIEAELLSVRGKVIHDCIEIDELLADEISDYFFKRNSREKILFYWLILNTRKFSLEDKIQLFKKIPYFRKRKYFEKVRSSLKYVQSLRNKLAHWYLVASKSKTNHILLKNPITHESFFVTNDVVREFDKHKNFLINFFLRKWKYNTLLESKSY